MCGIVGIVNYRTHEPVDSDVVHSMNQQVLHRGPDGGSIKVQGHVGFGHRRLAIIDLTDAGTQPMTTKDERFWITYNGEIYNFEEIRRNLESKGEQFYSASDTEVVLAAYRAYGKDCLALFRGMFAFAVWDDKEKSLFLARDRPGNKPLYYWEHRSGICFASEPKSFLKHPDFKVEPNIDAISGYLTHAYVPSPLSAFSGVRKLPPAHYMLLKDGKSIISRYWTLDYHPKHQFSENELMENLDGLIRQAVNRRMISDVPLGVFLSGGIDSATVVAYMAELSSSPIKTFTIGFDDEQYDEREPARLIAERYETEHHEFVVRPDVLGLLPKLIWHYNEPFADASAIPTFYLAEKTRDYVTVALNGDAGDENFAGYERYVSMLQGSRLANLNYPKLLRRSFEVLAAVGNAGGNPHRLQSFLETISKSRPARYAEWMAHFYKRDKFDLCTPDFLYSSSRDWSNMLSEQIERTENTGILDAVMSVDVNHFLPDNLLVKADIATMAFGLEGRSPFLDHDLMEFVARLPNHYKIDNGKKKAILKKLMKVRIPADILNKPKTGFGVPIKHWFRNELRDLVGDVLLSSRSRQRGYFRPGAVETILRDHFSDKGSRENQIWNLLVLEMWHLMFVDDPGELAEFNCAYHGK